MLWQPILRAVDRTGGHLEPEGTGAGRRFGVGFLSYGASFLAFGGGVLALHAVETTWRGGGVGAWVLLVPAGLAALLLASALAIGVWRGFGLRVEAIVLGLGSSVSVLFVLAAPLLLVLTAGIGETVLAGDPDRAAWWSRVVLGGTALIPLLGLGLGVYTVATSRHLWRPLERTHRHRGRRGIYREAVRGGALLVAARAFFGLYALAASGLVVLALGLAAAWGGQALGLLELDTPLLGAPSLTGPLLATAVGLPADHPAASGVARAGWLGWSVLVWALVALSVGHLVWTRHGLRRRLKKDRVRDLGSYPSLLQSAGRVLRKVRPPVHLVVTRCPRIWARSHRFAWPRRLWAVEVSTEALEELAPDEVEALLYAFAVILLLAERVDGEGGPVTGGA